ncbi:16982_t:CDS:1, partial [Funneliformis caledonium]
MTQNLLRTLSHDLINISKTGEFADVLIRVGEDYGELDTRNFQVHSIVLSARSKWFRAALSEAWHQTRKDNMILLSKPNIQPPVFEAILEYIYGGEFDPKNFQVAELIEILRAADELGLVELIKYIELYLKDNPEIICSNIVSIYEFSVRNDNFRTLHFYCSYIMELNPSLFFLDENFALHMSKETMITLLRMSNLMMNELNVWNNLVRWGIEQVIIENSQQNQYDTLEEYNDIIKSFTHEDFIKFAELLQPCIMLINFIDFTSLDYEQLVEPFINAIGRNDLNRIKRLISMNDDEISVKYSELLNPERAAELSIIISNMYNDIESIGLCDFNLLLRGSRDGMTVNAFTSRCCGKGPTVILARDKFNKHLYGAYYANRWDHPNYHDKVD